MTDQVFESSERAKDAVAAVRASRWAALAIAIAAGALLGLLAYRARR